MTTRLEVGDLIKVHVNDYYYYARVISAENERLCKVQVFFDSDPPPKVGDRLMIPRECLGGLGVRRIGRNLDPEDGSVVTEVPMKKPQPKGLKSQLNDIWLKAEAGP